MVALIPHINLDGVTDWMYKHYGIRSYLIDTSKRRTFMAIILSYINERKLVIASKNYSLNVGRTLIGGISIERGYCIKIGSIGSYEHINISFMRGIKKVVSIHPHEVDVDIETKKGKYKIKREDFYRIKDELEECDPIIPLDVIVENSSFSEIVK